MVKKLFKHEFLAALRLWLPMQIILLAVALFGRIVQFFETDTTAYDIVFGSSVVIYVLALITSVMLTLIFGIVRFYRNLFTHEGYLSFTLPVTATQHILVKTLVASASMIGTVLVAALSFVVISLGEVFAEVMKAAAYLIKQFAEEFGAGNTVAYVIEGIVLIALYIIMMYLLYYGCISLGQTFKKNRVVGAVGVYFIYYTIFQVFGTLVILLATRLSEYGFFRAIANFIDACPEISVHLILALLIFWVALNAAVYFLVSKVVIRNKLNLE
jgi:hypothetical protein